MFEDSLLDYAGRGKTKSPLTIAISLMLQTIAVGIVMLIPLIYTEALPRQKMFGFLVEPPAPHPPPAAPPKVRLASRTVPQAQVLVQPVRIPEHPAMIEEEILPPGPVVGIVPEASGLFTESGAGIGETMSAASLPLPPPSAATQPVRLNAGVVAAKLIYQPKPVYPPLARQVRVQGTVHLEAIISREGTIQNLTVLGGHPLLIPAAIEAVQQWRYQPTLLSGEPVEVVTTIEVTFTLGGR
jgi:protein TonB